MRYRGIDGHGTALDKPLRGINQGAGGNREIVNNQRGFSLHFADDLEDLGALVMSFALFVRDRD